MLSAGTVLTVSLVYLSFLFLLAYYSNRREASGLGGLINTPLVYTLSLSVYCTSWTFYGAVGSAARNGLEFMTIYLGPTLVFIGWWFLLRKLVRISKTHRITSIADFISSRYGKSARLAGLVTVMAVIGTTPYLALQLKAIATSFDVVSGAADASGELISERAVLVDTGFLVAVAMGLFIMLFGTRNIGADEHHPGVVAAIAFESLVKLIAIIGVGIFVVTSVKLHADSNVFSVLRNNREIADIFRMDSSYGHRWVSMLILAGAAIICLPRQFQIAVVEISDERNLRTASWLFPLYLFLITIFVIPIAVVGLDVLPSGADPDFFVLTLPMAADAEGLALLAFIGGFSSATSMMIVASIALSIMISNHLVMPVLLKLQGATLEQKEDLSKLVLTIRRLSIFFVLLLGYAYYRFSARSDALASIGLTAFAASAQFLPIIIGGIFWKHGSCRGAKAGLILGFVVWAFTLLLPSFERAGFISGLLNEGLFGLSFLRPEALFGFEGWDPLAHSLFWSYLFNIGGYVIGSLSQKQEPLELLQGTLFVDVFKRSQGDVPKVWKRTAATSDLLALTQRIVGPERAQDLFREFARKQGVEGLPQPSSDLIATVERQLAGGVGAASARVMVSRVAVGEAIGVDEMIEIVDEAQQVIEYSKRLEQKSTELEKTAAQLREANERLKRMDKMKDDFLSRVSHELRTPMTSIRSFSEILLNDENVSVDQSKRFLEIIGAESNRLTRMLNEILDIGQLENGAGVWNEQPLCPGLVLREALEGLRGFASQRGVQLFDSISLSSARILADEDRLKQLYINVLSNAIKFNNNDNPVVDVRAWVDGKIFYALVSDNGPGIAKEDQEVIFGKFQRRWETAEGSGLGLAISKQIIERLNGKIDVVSSLGAGATFKISIPLVEEKMGLPRPVSARQRFGFFGRRHS